MKRLAVALGLVCAFLALAPSAAHATTRCADGWLSPSPGGPGTCSHHGGISANDYSYSPDNSADVSGPTPPGSSAFRWTPDWTIGVIVVGGLVLFFGHQVRRDATERAEREAERRAAPFGRCACGGAWELRSPGHKSDYFKCPICKAKRPLSS